LRRHGAGFNVTSLLVDCQPGDLLDTQTPVLPLYTTHNPTAAAAMSQTHAMSDDQVALSVVCQAAMPV
jgi:hypothetical protein